MAFDTSRWRPARVIDNRPVAHGSMWLTLEAADALPAAYEPGHVLGLGIPHTSLSGVLRHAYTVSRGDPQARRFEHLYRVITNGDLTPRLAALPRGAIVFFHGPFHTPIQREISRDAGHIVLMSTGTGVGPLFGYVEKALNEGEARPISLYAGFREDSDICKAAELEALAKRYPNFTCHFSLTHPSTNWDGRTGRITACAPNLIEKDKLAASHFHLVGNGSMVHLMRKALYRAGISHQRVSIEIYFNHDAQPSDAEVDELAAAFTDRDRQTRNRILN